MRPPRGIDERALAKFLPADPAVWFDAALDAKLDVSVSDQFIGWAPPEDPRQGFLLAWMCATPNGWRALARWMLARGIARTI